MNINLSEKRSCTELLLHTILYILLVLPGSSSYASDIIHVNATDRTLENFTFENGTTGTFIIQAANDADVTVTNGILNSSGDRGGGAWIHDSTFTAQNLAVNVSGNSGTGVYLVDDSRAMMNDITIVGQGNASGLILDGAWSMNNSQASAEVTHGTITTATGDAIRVSAGALTLNDVTASTTGRFSYALNLNYSSANVTAEGGSLSTQGDYSDAVWVGGDTNSVIRMNNATLSTTGDRSRAVNVRHGSAIVTNSTLTTSGKDSYGLATEHYIQGDGLSIVTSGAGGAGMLAAQGGTGELTNSTIVTSGGQASGLVAYSGSQITADNVTVETSGLTGFGLWSRGGTLNISNSDILTTGEKASGLYVNVDSSIESLINSTNNVQLDSVVLWSSEAQAVEVSASNLTLNVKDSVLTGGNGKLMTVSSLENVDNVSNNLSSDVSFNAVRSILAGDIAVSNTDNRVTVNLTSSSLLMGAVNNVSSLALDSTSYWNVNNSSDVGLLTNNGTITFPDQYKFDTLTVTGDYAGDGGLLIMNSVLGDDSSAINKLIIGGDVLPGTTSVMINNLGGYGAQTIEGIEVVDVAGTSLGSFVKSGRIVAGAYDYDLVKQGEDWYLTSQLTPVTPVLPEQEPEADSTETTLMLRPEGGSYTANLAAANRLFIMSLHDRFGDTQFIDPLTGQPEITSFWLRQTGGHNAWRDGSGQLKTQSNRYIAQMGGDFARWNTGTGRWHIGFMAGYGNEHSASDSQYSGYQARGKVDGYSVGSYAAWHANGDEQTGAWLGSWLLYSWFNNEVRGQSLAMESYKSQGFTASLEGGYTWKLGEFVGGQGTLNKWFIQPQAQVVWMGVRADDHQEANGTKIRGQGDGNWQTRLGIKTWLRSHHKRDNDKQREFQPFISLNWLHNTRNFATKMDEVYVSQNGAVNIAEVKVGLEGQINPWLNIWGNVGVQVGDAGYNDTAAALGVRYNF